MDEERDLVEFVDDQGNTITLEVLDYFFYEGQEYALLAETDGAECEECDDGSCAACENTEVYVMRVDQVGEDEESFSDIEDDALVEKLIDFVQNELYADEDDEDDFFDEDGFEDAKDE